MERDIKPTYDELESYVENLQKQLADAQATIAALQARVRELEEWVQDQSTANLETMRHTDEMQSRALEAEQQLTRRTAELERVRGERQETDEAYYEVGHFNDTLREQNRVLRSNLVNCVARLEAYYGEDYPAVRDAKAALTTTSQPAQEQCSYCKRPLTDNHSFSYGVPGVPRVYKCDRADCTKPATSQPVPPYKEWCRHPEKCAGLASCPQDPTCAD